MMVKPLSPIWMEYLKNNRIDWGNLILDCGRADQGIILICRTMYPLYKKSNRLMRVRRKPSKDFIDSVMASIMSIQE